MNNYHQARTWLLKSIDGKRDVGSITPGELKRWQGAMAKLALTSRNSHANLLSILVGDQVSTLTE